MTYYIPDDEPSVDRASKRPQVIETGLYPLERLTDRVFEQLVAEIYDADSESDLAQIDYDRVELMRGVGEKGRDVVLWKSGQVAGVVQCKHSIHTSEKVDQPVAGKELLKVLLYSISDPEFSLKDGEFAWHIATNTDLSGPGREFAATPYAWFLRHKDDLKQWTNEVLAKNKSIGLVYDESLEEKLLERLARVRARPVNGTDISTQIERSRDRIASQFFRLRPVIDAAIMERIIELGDKIAASFSEDPPLEETINTYLQQTYDDALQVQSLIFDSKTVPLKQIYQPLVLSKEKDKKIKIPINGYPEQLLRRNSRILIESTAGMGKSTILKYITLAAIETKSTVPILVKLRRLTPSHSVEDEVINQISPLEGIQPQPLLRAISKGGFLILFDGYDEIADEHKASATEQMLDFIRKAPAAAFIVTSRPDTSLRSLPKFEVYKVENLTPESASELIRRYGSVAHAAQAERLIRDLEGRTDSVHEFLANPMLAALLYRTYVYRPSLAHKRTVFYDTVYRALFDEHDIFKEAFRRRRRSSLSRDEFEKIVQVFAWKGVAHHRVTYSQGEALAAIAAAVKHCCVDVRPSDVLHDMLQAVPLLVREGDYVSWSHRSLQEYFSARFIQSLDSNLQRSALRRLYEYPRMASIAETVGLFNDLEPLVFRHTMLLWILLESEAAFARPKSVDGVSEEERKTRAALDFEVSMWCFCFYSKQALVADPAEQQDERMVSESIEAHILSLEASTGVRIRGSGIATIRTDPVLVVRNAHRNPKLLLVLFRVLNRQRNPELHKRLYNWNSYKGIEQISCSSLAPNVWYHSNGMKINFDGVVEPLLWDQDSFTHANRILVNAIRPLIPAEVSRLRAEIEAEIDSHNRSGAALLDEF